MGSSAIPLFAGMFGSSLCLHLLNISAYCSFRPETLACRTDQDSETCLTITQIQTVHKIHSDYYDTNQTYIFGGFYPGSENGLFDTVVGPEPNPTGLQYFQDWVTKLSIVLCDLSDTD